MLGGALEAWMLVWPGTWHTVKCASLWPNGAWCLDQSRNCGPLLHTPEDVLLPMVFIKQVINGLCVCGPVQTVFTGPVWFAGEASTGRGAYI